MDTWRGQGGWPRHLSMWGTLSHYLDLILPPINPINPETIRKPSRKEIAPPQASVPKRSHLEPYSGALPEGGTIAGGFFINLATSMMMCE